jgi:hypothetical protein
MWYAQNSTLSSAVPLSDTQSSNSDFQTHPSQILVWHPPNTVTCIQQMCHTQEIKQDSVSHILPLKAYYKGSADSQRETRKVPVLIVILTRIALFYLSLVYLYGHTSCTYHQPLWWSRQHLRMEMLCPY